MLTYTEVVTGGGRDPIGDIIIFFYYCTKQKTNQNGQVFVWLFATFNTLWNGPETD